MKIHDVKTGRLDADDCDLFAYSAYYSISLPISLMSMTMFLLLYSYRLLDVCATSVAQDKQDIYHIAIDFKTIALK